LLFAIYSFNGWVLEVIYRSITQRKFVNAGFLFGPFLPIYGLGATFVILLQFYFQTWPLVPRILIYGLALTVIEYVVGLLAEKIFKLKLWDYSDNKLNFQGRVCLLFSSLWTVLALVFVKFIHPSLSLQINTLDTLYVKTAAIIFLIYLATDFTYSVISLKAFRRKVIYLYSEYFNLSNGEITNIFNSFQRLRNAFPDLNRYINININNEIKNRVSTFLKSIRGKIILEMQGRKPFEQEYLDIIGDISEHEEFMKLKQFFHHNASAYIHVHDVAYLSYRISKFLKLDCRSTARGALLHDFFLYDWRHHDVPDLPRKKFHGLAHPKIALDNARKYFTVNEIEEDIIRKHMWPLTIVPPRYKESFIVSFADKYLSSKEFISEFNKRRRNKRHAHKALRRSKRSGTD
jgi:uncharacterized membrane protein/HD superfamily phosphodiesterase